MQKNKKSNTHVLKCDNCGSTSYKEDALGIFKCNYCGATFKHKREEVEPEVFFEEVSTSSDGLYYCDRTITKEEFFKKAIMYLALHQNSPEDILTATIEDVKEEWGAYLVMNNNYDAIQQKSFAVDEETKKSVYTKRIIQCQKLRSTGDEDQEMAILNRLNYFEILEDAKPLTKSTMRKLAIAAPTEAETKAEAERLVLSYKKDILDYVGKMATYVEHETKSTRVYMIPEYSLEFRYKGQIYKIISFADDIKMVGNIPDFSQDLKKQISQKTTKYYVTSLLASFVTIIFAIVFLNLRTQNLYGTQIAFMMFSIFVYMFVILLIKKATNKLMQKRFERRVKDIENYLQRENVSISPLDYDYMNSFKGWC